MSAVPLVRRLRPTLDAAVRAYAGRPAEAALTDAVARVDQPLRVAIAGRVKAGKSTLLNALVGEELAPTDAGECTTIVTWYRDGHTYRVVAEGDAPGDVAQLPFRRDGGALHVDLGERDAASVRRLLVDWPSRRLREMTLIDTPGIASISSDVSQRTVDLLASDDQRATEADAVLYLLRHVHSEDVRFLEAFHDDELAHATPVNAVGVLSRADEIGVCRLDALESAARVASSWRDDGRLRRLVQTVVPVAGLVAQAGVSLTEDEFRTVRAIAAMSPARHGELLLTVDRVVAERTDCDAVPAEREHLLRRMGLFGVRLAVQHVVDDPSATATTLSRAMLEASGLVELRRVLTEQLGARANVLKARSAALLLDRVLDEDPIADAGRLRNDLDAVLAGAHEIAELRLLGELRSGLVRLRDDDLAAAERLLGTDGLTVTGRLGLPDDAADDVDALRVTASEELARWQKRAESPLASREARDAARVLVRSCEGLLMTIAGVG